MPLPSLAGQSFTLDLTKFIEKTKIKPGLVVKKVAMDMYSTIVTRTPVDTGRARANWQLTVNSMPSSGIVPTKSKKSETFPAPKTPNITVGPADVVFITNNVSYISCLEYGTSKMAPRGMVRLTIAEFQSYIAKAVASLP